MPGKAFCKGGTETCEVCLGSCGIEEYQDTDSAATPSRRSREETASLIKLARARALFFVEHHGEPIGDLARDVLDLAAELERLDDFDGSPTANGLPGEPR